MRIVPLTEPYQPDADEVLTRMMPPGVAPIALFRTFANNLPMSRAMWTWGRYELGRDLSLSLRQREIVIDRVCARLGCEYEWGVHVAHFTEKAEFTEAQVRSLTHGGASDSCWSEPSERALIVAVDELCDQAMIADELWSELAVHLDDAQLLDLTMLAGWYHAIAFTARASQVPLEDWAPRFADYA